MARPPKYTLEELQTKIEEYYPQMESVKRILTKANLILWLDISRKTYNEWKKDKHEFSNALKEVELEIEDKWIQRLKENSVAGAIFYLKNAFKEDYKDRHETDITSKGEKITPIFNGESISKHESNDQDIQPKE